MINKETYKNWFLPSLLKDSAWNEFIDVVLSEIVDLQRYNMGSYNAVGFNTVEEDVKFEYSNFWDVVSDFDAGRGIYIKTSEGFSLSGNEAVFTKNPSTDSILITNYAFVLGKEFDIEFDIYDIDYTSDTELFYGFKDNFESSIIGMGDDTISVKTRLTADDYYFHFGVYSGNNGAGFKIKNLKITGVIEDSDEADRRLVLLRLTSVNSASRYFLEKMRDSLNFPSIANMPEELLRQILKDFNTFISYNGSPLASVMFFYFLGYTVDIDSLYARIGDYESNDFPYIAQKVDDLLESDRAGTVYGEVAETRYSNNVIKLKEGHQVISGDLVANADNPFPNTFVKVLRISGQLVYLDRPVTVNYDSGSGEGDLIDIYRLYTYPVNPDPDSYFKTSHIDVFFKKSKYSSNVDINFVNLEKYFERYLPINVVIRFFGFKDTIDEESFTVGESFFSMIFDKTAGIDVGERVTFPKDSVAYMVGEKTPETHEDIYGDMVDGYSYLISHYENGEPVYLVIPYEVVQLYSKTNLHGDFTLDETFTFNGVLYLWDRTGFGRHLPVVSGNIVSGRLEKDAIIDMTALGSFFDKRNRFGGSTGIERWDWPLLHYDVNKPFEWKVEELDYAYIISKLLNTNDYDRVFTDSNTSAEGLTKILYYTQKQVGDILVNIKDYLGITI